MSKKIKSLIEKELSSKLSGVEGLAVINPRGLDGNKNNKFRHKLHDKGLKMLVVKNTLARRASESTKVKGFDKLLDGPSALIYGKAGLPDIARLLIEEKKENDQLELRGIFFDGEAYAGEEGVKTVSAFPTREEAIAGIVAALLGAGGGLVGAIQGPGGSIGGILSAIEEKKKDSDGAVA
ncbi:MAG: 50S ribosomal protein L10 [Phycisphaerae bacterium]|jgi:large subunit ribosomal protein L10|nr:MAG: 50S ribosomal protein L10 [Phycisphaerae bacterium]